MTPLNDAETSRGPWHRSHAGGSASLGEVRPQPARRGSARGATIGRFLAAGDRVLAPARPAAGHRSTARAPSEVLGAALGDLEPQPLGIRRVAAQVGHGVLLRGAWPPRWVCRSGAHAPCAGRVGWPPLHHIARPPHPGSDRPGCCRRTARADGPAPAGRGNRCTSAPPFEDSSARKAADPLTVFGGSSTPTAPIGGAWVGTSRHFVLPSVEGGQHFPLLMLRHAEVLKGAAKLGHDLVKHLGCNL
jgi:hypothetical protein